MLAPRVGKAGAVHLSKLVAANDNHKYCRAKNDNAAARLKTVTQGATTVTSASDGLSRAPETSRRRDENALPLVRSGNLPATQQFVLRVLVGLLSVQ